MLNLSGRALLALSSVGEEHVFRTSRNRRRLSTALLAGLLTLSGLAAAHDYRLGALRIDHPYAIPAPAGASSAAAYVRGIRNTGEMADRLIGASTPVASRVEIHRKSIDASGAMRMREIPAIELAPRSETRLRHDGEHHLMLIELKRPLQEGERFPLTLRFEKAGEREVTVWVQAPRAGVQARPHPH